MEGRIGPDRAPHCDRAELMKANGEFIRLLGTQYEIVPTSYIPPEIPRRGDYLFPEIDNGPARETLADSISAQQAAERRITEAVATTAAMVNEMVKKDQRQNPWKRPKVGEFGIVDLGATDCRFPMTDEGPHLFCGSPVVDGLPYCHHHCQKAFRGVWSKQ